MSSRRSGRIPIDRDVHIPCAILLVILVVAWAYSVTWLWILALILLIILGSFFRDPPRRVPKTPGAVVSPADGVIDEILTNTDPTKGPVGGPIVAVALNIFNVHINRCPYEGEVRSIRYVPGLFANALKLEKARENESNWIFLDCGRYQITVRQMVGAVARRIVCRVRPGQVLRRGQRIGLIRFGSRTELYLPPEARLQVEVGQKVSGGTTVMAYLPAD